MARGWFRTVKMQMTYALPGIPVEYIYPLLALFMWTLVVVLVPKDKFRELLWAGLVWGLLMSFIYGTLFGRILHLFTYEKTLPFAFFGHPIWINFAWIPAIMIYLYYLPNRKLWYAFPIYLGLFAGTSCILQRVLHNAGLLIYHNWNELYRFLTALVWFYGAARHYRVLSSAETGNGEKPV